MDAYLYHNKSNRRRIDKDIEQVGDLINVQFLEESSMIRPVLKLSSDLEPVKANYLWLKDFNRYYYINNETVCNGYIRIECEVDVLMSFALELLESFVLVSRNNDKSKFDLYLPDDKLQLEERTAIRTIGFDQGPDSFSTETNFTLVLAGAYDGNDDNEEEENNG